MKIISVSIRNSETKLITSSSAFEDDFPRLTSGAVAKRIVSGSSIYGVGSSEETSLSNLETLRSRAEKRIAQWLQPGSLYTLKAYLLPRDHRLKANQEYTVRILEAVLGNSFKVKVQRADMPDGETEDWGWINASQLVIPYAADE